MRLRIAPLDHSDLPSIVQLEESAHSHPWPEAQFQQRIQSDSQIHAAAWNDDQLLAYYFASQVVDQAELLNIAVAPKAQGQGLGEQMLQHLLDHLSSDINEVFLEVRASNAAAIALYEKLGFNQMGVRNNYYPCEKNGREDALLYGLSVGSSMF